MNIEQQSESSATLLYCWLREAAPGHLEHDGGLRIAKSDLLQTLFGIHPAQMRTFAGPAVCLDEVLTTLSSGAPFDNVPVWARRRLANILGPLAFAEQRRAAAINAGILMDVAHRILAATPDGSEVEVHLPYIDRRAWSNRFEILQQTEFVLHQGRVLPTALLSPGRLDEYNAQLLAVSSAIPQVTVDHAATYSNLVPAQLVEPLLPVDPVAVPRLESGTSPIAVNIRLSLAPSACRAWNSAPIEKSLAYFHTHAAVSVAVQTALRRWLGWYWLSNLENFSDTLGICTVLAYVCSRPYPGKRRTDFTYDTLTSEWMHTAFHCARRPLRILLKSVRAALKAAGRRELAEAYHPDEAKIIIQRIRKQRKAIQAVVAAEGDIVNYILKYGLTLRNVSDPISITRDAPDFIQGLSSRLRKLFQQQDLAWMAPVLMLVATDALSMALGGEPGLRASVTYAASPLAAPSLTLLEPQPGVVPQSQPAASKY